MEVMRWRVFGALIVSFGLILVSGFLQSGYAQWSHDAAMNNPVTTATSDQVTPVSVGDGSGGVIIAWVDYRSGISPDIYAQRIDANGYAKWAAGGVVVCNVPDIQQNPVIASDGAGGAIIAWQDARSGSNFDIYAQRLNGNGIRLWINGPDSGGVQICTATNNQQNPTIVRDGAGSDHRLGG